MVFQRGDFSLQVPCCLFKDNRQRLCAELRKSGKVPAGSWVLLEGGKDVACYDTDSGYECFRQESYFHWTFGVEEPDFYGGVEVDTGRAVLFMPRLPEEYAIWLGKINPPEHFKDKYDVDGVYYTDEICVILGQLSPSLLLLMHGLNTDSGQYAKPAEFEGLCKFQSSQDILHPIIAECRVFKTDQEIEVLRYACQVSCEAHKYAIRSCKPGMYEFQLESLFRHYCYHNGGCRHVAYCCISASGPHGAILHYGHAAEPNSKQIQSGDLCLTDMGAQYCCYSADITTTYPANGKFTDDQKIIYRAVFDANRSVMAALKPGVCWVDMHALSLRVILQHLLRAGLVVGDVDEMLKADVGAVFMPHGLGHLLGLDVHDVGGYHGCERPKEPSFKKLRTARKLEARMFITVEPGCYFIDPLLDDALTCPVKSKFLVKEAIERFRGFGGVRIEDDVLITETGCENFSANLPRSVEEIEAFMSGSEQACH